MSESRSEKDVVNESVYVTCARRVCNALIHMSAGGFKREGGWQPFLTEQSHWSRFYFFFKTTTRNFCLAVGFVVQFYWPQSLCCTIVKNACIIGAIDINWHAVRNNALLLDCIHRNNMRALFLRNLANWFVRITVKLKCISYENLFCPLHDDAGVLASIWLTCIDGKWP